MEPRRKLLGEILVEEGWANPDQIEEALAFQLEKRCRIGEALVALGYVDEERIARALGKQHGLPFVDLGRGVVPAGVLSQISAEVAAEFRVVPVKTRGKELFVAFDDPLQTVHLDPLRFLTNREVKAAISTSSALRAALSRYYGVEMEAPPPPEVRAAAAAAAAAAEAGDDAPIIRLVHQTVEDAVRARASDIHIEPFADRVRVRYRIDGQCLEVAAHPSHLRGPLISRVKIMSSMDIAEKRKPQDGRFHLRVADRDLDMRVSALPSNHGESLVLRILDRKTGLVGLESLGFSSQEYARFRRIIRRPNGIFLVTGPTGSGKTTTLYAALRELNRPDVKIITAENPIEYHISGINQCEVRHSIGLDFARILRSMLRQAPNIILVGEIRDRETAEIAIQASLTGHLVFSTLHTNDAPSAIIRLIDMGVKPFLVSSSVVAALAQRLVRVLCKKCRQPVEYPDSFLAGAGIPPERVAGKSLYRAVGCDACRQTGFRGRLGLFELMEMDPVLREMSYRKASAAELRRQARLSGGMTSLREDGIRKVLEGITTLEEVLAVTQGDRDASP
jgi:type IV pilus assembly protein PilB